MGVLSQKLIFAVWLICNPGICSSEFVTIERGFQKDVFIVPVSKCDSGKNFCKEFNAKRDVGNCQCVCEHPNATFTFHKGSWTCVGSERTFEGCAQRTHFQNEDGRLIVLKNEAPEFLALNRRGKCKVSSSQYTDCRGNQVATMVAAQETFNIEWDPEKFAYSFELNLERAASMALKGKIVTTDINCTSGSLPTQQICLTFKVHGTTICPITSPPTNKLTAIIDATPAITTEFQMTFGPNVAADQRKISDETAFSKGFIAGISVALVVLILATGIFIFYCKSGRKQDRWPDHRTVESTRTNTSELSSGNPEDTYATFHYRDSGIYASSYSIPTTGQARSPANIEEEPQYSAIEEYNRATGERQQNNIPIRIEQRVYNLVEDFETAPTIEEPYEYTYSSIDGQQNETAFPMSVEQRVYNFVEELQSKTQEGHKDVSTRDHQNNALIRTGQQQQSKQNSTKENPSNAPISVEQRVYNLMEDLDIVTENPTNQRSNRKRSVEQRVYSLVHDPERTISESPCDDDTGNKKRNTIPLSVEQRVYSLVENLGTKTYEELHNFETKYPEYKVLEKPTSNSVCTRAADSQCTIDKRATTF